MVNEAVSVAVEHLQWCRRNGVSPRELLEMIEWEAPVMCGDDLVMAVARTWLRWRMQGPDVIKLADRVRIVAA